MSKYKIEKIELEEIVKSVLSIAEVCRKLDIRPAGGNYKTLKKYFRLYDIDISHFTGQGWNVGKRYKNFGKTYSLEEIMIENSTYTSTSKLKKRLVDEGLKNNKCEECNITNWNNKPISLHLDHINGNNLDNRLLNLRILCPNCHSQTDTYCSKNNNISKTSELRLERYSNKDNYEDIIKLVKKKREIKEKNLCECGKQIKNKSKKCNNCHLLSLRKVERPTIEQLEIEIKELGYRGTGRKYGVSDNAIRKWLK